MADRQVSSGAGRPATPQRRPAKKARAAPQHQPRWYVRDKAVSPLGLHSPAPHT
jgi:hypothetical protein